ncbi:conserved protein of unknown function [Ectopseudomonas oleovorans]|uniref:Uncharacterized protein n=1 Tax=Ectopseudomonas oleovorans TaxID=301 RepID=A0A653BA62_ECTOL|nr:conserved protein of unknown function [Pseudomonas oleovorans]
MGRAAWRSVDTSADRTAREAEVVFIGDPSTAFLGGRCAWPITDGPFGAFAEVCEYVCYTITNNLRSTIHESPGIGAIAEIERFPARGRGPLRVHGHSASAWRGNAPRAGA